MLEECYFCYHRLPVNKSNTVKHVKGTEYNLKICTLYTGSNYIHYSLNEENKTGLYIQ